jgi:hypothetical protein
MRPGVLTRRCRDATRRFRCLIRHVVTGNPLTPPFPAGLEQAVFGMGCFWGAGHPSKPAETVEIRLPMLGDEAGPFAKRTYSIRIRARQLR